MINKTKPLLQKSDNTWHHGNRLIKARVSILIQWTMRNSCMRTKWVSVSYNRTVSICVVCGFIVDKIYIPLNNIYDFVSATFITGIFFIRQGQNTWTSNWCTWIKAKFGMWCTWKDVEVKIQCTLNLRHLFGLWLKSTELVFLFGCLFGLFCWFFCLATMTNSWKIQTLSLECW